MDLDPDLLSWRATHEPARRAVFWDGRWLTYGELSERADRTAARLAALGLAAGDRVGILAENHLAHLDLYFAAARTGTVVVPYNYRLAPAELAALVEYTEPSVLFVQPDLAGSVADARLPVLSVDETTTEAPARKSAALGRPRIDDHAMLLFTGGTTGLPKAACITHRQIVVNAIATVFSWGLRPDDGYVCATPMFHAALHALATPLLHLGGQVLLQRRFDPQEYLEWTSIHRPTLLFLVPTMYQMLTDAPGFDAADLSPVRWAISGGAPCPEPVRRRFAERGVLFHQGYGLTECGVNCFALSPEEAQSVPEAVGRPILHLEARLAGEDGGAVAAEGEGELWLSGPVVMDGYFRRPDASAEVLVERDGRTWLRTGDIARRDGAGRYTIVGRRKEMFVSGGENVYPAEVERALYEHPAVRECVVVGVPSEQWGEVGLAAVVAAPGASADAESLRAFVRERLARYKVPRHWVFVDALPRSAAGKILRREVAGRWGPAASSRQS